MSGGLRPWHIIVLVVVLIVLFGAKRLPDAARSLGRSMRIFKAETKGLMEDSKTDAQAGSRVDSKSEVRTEIRTESTIDDAGTDRR
jgi:sec-independent protein translocase protein TatA